ncbi:hypothetical protein NEOLI_002399, partial [Neolecta irregularis DAH-3]
RGDAAEIGHPAAGWLLYKTSTSPPPHRHLISHYLYPVLVSKPLAPMKKHPSSLTKRPRSAETQGQSPSPGHLRTKSSPNPAIFIHSPHHQRRKKRDPDVFSTPVAVQKKKYAGAVFQSSPAPCTLPPPNFSRSVPQKSCLHDKPDIQIPASLSNLRESPLGLRIRQPAAFDTFKSSHPRFFIARPPSRTLSERSSHSSSSESADLTFSMDLVDETPTRKRHPRSIPREENLLTNKSLELESRSKALLAILCEQPHRHRERTLTKPPTASAKYLYDTLAAFRPPVIKHVPIPTSNIETIQLQVQLKQILNIA